MAVFSLVAVIAMFGGGKANPPNSAGLAVNAAFRDGVYLGRRDAEAGSKPSPLKSRWNSEADRRAFAAGYFQGYMVEVPVKSAGRWIPQPIDNKGFEDGRQDGIADRESAQMFNLRVKERFRNPAMGCAQAGGDVQACAGRYRDAYMTGYQHGYYQIGGRMTPPRARKTNRPQNV